MHQVAVRGPEGEQEVRDEKGKPVEGGHRVKFVGYQEYVRGLMADAGLIDLELEKLVQQLKDVDRRWQANTRGIPTLGRVKA